MNRYLTLIFVILMTSLVASAQKDLVITKQGFRVKTKIKQISSQNIVVEATGANGNTYEEGYPVENCYMIKLDKRGNMFFHPDGTRTTEDFKKKPRGADAIYLTNGSEIYGYNVQVGDKVYYMTEKGNDVWANYMKQELPLNQVFLVVYSDDTSIVVTDLEKISNVASDQETPVLEQTVTDEVIEEPLSAEPQLEVKFHQVAKGETLLAISQKYGVDPKDILEWNELPVKTNPKSVMPVDMQLMIYVPIKTAD